MGVVAPAVVRQTPDAHMSTLGLPVTFEHFRQMSLAVHQMTYRIRVPGDLGALGPVAVVPTSDDVEHCNTRQSRVKPRPEQVKGARSVRKSYNQKQQMHHDIMVLGGAGLVSTQGKPHVGTYRGSRVRIPTAPLWYT